MFFAVVSVFLWYSSSFFISVDAACQTDVCPIICSGGCMDPEEVTIDPTSMSDCLEVVIESPGYPHGYPQVTCQWNFDTRDGPDPPFRHSSVVATFLDFDGHPDDDLLIQRTRTARGGDDVDNIFNNDASRVNFDDPFERTFGYLIVVRFEAEGIRYDRRGFRLRLTFSELQSTEACTGDPSPIFDMTDVKPVSAISSLRYPRNYRNNRLCYYRVNSPNNTRIVLEFLSTFNIVNYDDYLYIYDNAEPSNPKLLRIISHSDRAEVMSIKTQTNRLQFAFETSGSNVARGFFIRTTFEDVPGECSGNGVQTDQCDCFEMDAEPQCEVSATETFDDSAIGMQGCGLPALVSLTPVTGFNTIVSATTVNDGSADSEQCQWDFNGVEGQQYVVIFRSFTLDDTVPDTFEIRYNDGREESAIFRRSGGISSIPVDRGSVTDVIGKEIKIDSHQFQVLYNGLASTLTSPRGPLFEVHLLSVDKCNQPCFNGGVCTSFCTCDYGFQGDCCEHTIPPDYTCLVKNHYVRPNFAYPSELYAIAGTNVFHPDSFTFDIYWSFGSLEENEEVFLPSNAMVTPLNYGSVLSLPSECDKKTGQSRFGVFLCQFQGSGIVDPLEIPVIITPTSAYIKPVGRFTKTVSVEDGDVTLSVELGVSVKEDRLRWRFNGRPMGKWKGQSSITLPDITTEDAGIYECFLHGRDSSEYDLVAYRLIVRACPSGMYGPPACTGTCPNCQNGGTCYDRERACICPPGYSGQTCENMLTADTVSMNTDKTCTGLGITYDLCKYVLFCLPDPGGCMCMTGWTGHNCNLRCPPSKYGLDCQFDCVCGPGERCDAFTGDCFAIS